MKITTDLVLKSELHFDNYLEVDPMLLTEVLTKWELNYSHLRMRICHNSIFTQEL